MCPYSEKACLEWCSQLLIGQNRFMQKYDAKSKLRRRIFLDIKILFLSFYQVFTSFSLGTENELKTNDLMLNPRRLFLAVHE